MHNWKQLRDFELRSEVAQALETATSDITPVVSEALSGLFEMIDRLTTRVETLESRADALEGRDPEDD